MITPWEILRRVQPLEVIAKAVAVTLAYLLGFAITSHFHEASSLTGAMLACVSAIVVQQQPDIRHAVQQGWLRVLGTFIGAVVAYVYLVNFRFSPAGMVVAVVLEEVICMMFKGAGQRQNGYDHAYHRTDRLGTFPRPVAIGQRTAALLGGDGRCRGRYCGGMARRPLPPLASGFGCLFSEGVIREVAHTRQQVARRHPAFAGDLQFVDDDAAVGAGDREVGALVGLDGAGPLHYPPGSKCTAKILAVSLGSPS